jgi:hypothetical protein
MSGIRQFKVGDWVMTPDGPGKVDRIISDRDREEWVFGRKLRREALVFVEYRNGHKHPWVYSKVKLL